ncbi:hypothetical protein KSP39_PZI003734 [Platanthera zijinensis]|uniref:Serine-rich protein-like protein n=1 Tax=Platanthera zijinensis TaxID=2320716 RepID=A0AAP0BTN0_9ASPA
MSDSSRSRSSAPVLPATSDYKQSFFPSDRFYTSAFSSPAAGSCVASSSTFSTQSHKFPRPASPTRVSLIGSPPPPSSLRFAIDRPISPGRSISAVSSRDPIIPSPFSASVRGRTCLCSPTTHPGSFRCSLHKGLNHQPAALISSPSSRLNARRSAMTNSLVRIATVEGELVKRALSALIRPSSHHQRRRQDFQPRPSRLFVMSKAGDL